MKKENLQILIASIALTVFFIAILMAILHPPSQLNDGSDIESPHIDGIVEKISENGSFENETIYLVALDDGHEYQMLFRNESASPPPVGEELRFYYIMLNKYYDVYRIKSL